MVGLGRTNNVEIIGLGRTYMVVGLGRKKSEIKMTIIPL